ncbi:hypothetical protein NG697_12555 [Pseudarthrobacter sp. MDT3-26]|uniref:hypothetical protein n=1 Tax=Pseudarthrobacter raffinosi TaxID=2953651 RepID=UPI00208F55A4|nr:hypothetical protein [Pseudarthrobacter sp. MDT3-26]MCO4263743.1 hypothetical protein [Pseudarthrobacter sp. MDT3-26]
MTAQAIIIAGYHRPDLAAKLEVLRSQFGYSESRAVNLFGKTMTLAVIRGGELLIAEGRLERSVGSYAKFFPKGHRTADDTWDTRGIIGHATVYGRTPDMSRNAQAEFAAITAESVHFYLATREQSAQEDTAR